jgi:FkbM family methyltransferase
MLDFSLVGLAQDECRTIVDLGANEGQFLFSALAYYSSPRCLVVEMLPDLAARLRGDPRLADRRRFVVVQAAVGEREQEQRVLRSVHSEASSLLPLRPEAAGLYGIDLTQFEAGNVRVRTLDALCAEHGFGEVDLLKIDVQGYEEQVLRGGPVTLAHTRRLIIEVEYVPVYEGQTLVDGIRAAVESAGFDYVCNVTEYRSAEGTLLHADALFRRSGPAVTGLAGREAE